VPVLCIHADGAKQLYKLFKRSVEFRKICTTDEYRELAPYTRCSTTIVYGTQQPVSYIQNKACSYGMILVHKQMSNLALIQKSVFALIMKKKMFHWP